uniref:THAP-type domain-containing protein n=1 Tax=Neogobius melanostomus TaxID=47308 RepID=A0A8C6SWU9_9GOBI
MENAFCCAVGCTNKAYKKCSISSFPFPLGDPDQLDQWVLKMRRLNWTPNSFCRLCSEHFESDCFTKDLGVPRLHTSLMNTCFCNGRRGRFTKLTHKIRDGVDHLFYKYKRVKAKGTLIHLIQLITFDGGGGEGREKKRPARFPVQRVTSAPRTQMAIDKKRWLYPECHAEVSFERGTAREGNYPALARA